MSLGHFSCHNTRWTGSLTPLLFFFLFVFLHGVPHWRERGRKSSRKKGGGRKGIVKGRRTHLRGRRHIGGDRREGGGRRRERRGSRRRERRGGGTRVRTHRKHGRRGRRGGSSRRRERGRGRRGRDGRGRGFSFFTKRRNTKKVERIGRRSHITTKLGHGFGKFLCTFLSRGTIVVGGGGGGLRNHGGGSTGLVGGGQKLLLLGEMGRGKRRKRRTKRKAEGLSGGLCGANASVKIIAGGEVKRLNPKGLGVGDRHRIESRDGSVQEGLVVVNGRTRASGHQGRTWWRRGGTTFFGVVAGSDVVQVSNLTQDLLPFFFITITFLSEDGGRASTTSTGFEPLAHLLEAHSHKIGEVPLQFRVRIVGVVDKNPFEGFHLVGVVDDATLVRPSIFAISQPSTNLQTCEPCFTDQLINIFFTNFGGAIPVPIILLESVSLFFTKPHDR